MNYLSLLTEDEIRCICSIIPRPSVINYFKNNPKGFAKICPGFRPNTVTNTSRLLFAHRNHNFISGFIEKIIGHWLKEIEEHYEKCLRDGDNKELAMLRTLSPCFFANNVELYFKLSQKDYSDEFITLLSSAIGEINKYSEKQKNNNEAIKSNETIISNLNLEIESYRAELTNAKDRLTQKFDEIKALTLKIADFKKLANFAQVNEQASVSLKNIIKTQKETIDKLTTELSDATNSRELLEVQIREELEKQQANKAFKQTHAVKLKRPSDMDEFKEFLGYNFEGIGVSPNSGYYLLLMDQLSQILFQGVPILINRKAGMMILKCLANALIRQSAVKTLTFKREISIAEISDFMSSAGRIVCLDNFIGNYNETELLPLFDYHKDQIIFLIFAYDRTLQYVSEEFFSYCQYLNLNRIVALSDSLVELTEDPSEIEETEYTFQRTASDKRFSPLLRDMLNEFGFLRGLIEHKCATISDEQDLCRVLAFDVLPYCVDVLQIAPYNCSERFLKYAGDAGRCPYKNLFKEWFA